MLERSTTAAAVMVIAEAVNGVVVAVVGVCAAGTGRAELSLLLV